jgi:hypothetical protein
VPTRNPTLGPLARQIYRLLVAVISSSGARIPGARPRATAASPAPAVFPVASAARIPGARPRAMAASPAPISLTYGALAAALEQRIHPRSPRLHAALTEVTLACRARGLPALPALVWRAGVRQPADGYFKIAHPRARSLRTQIAAWREEYARVVATPPDRWPRSP